jgi:diacylglycerol kinase family enzyme
MPAMRAIVIINSAAGSVRSSDGSAESMQVEQALQRAGVEVDLRPTPPEALEQAARAAAAEKPDAVVAAGGDGTLSAVAAALVGGEVPLGALAAGTWNHFVKDARLPLEIGAAAEVIARRQVKRVDVGEVNGRIFLNNSSIGLYPSIVRRRDQIRERFGRSKFAAMVTATLLLMRRHAVVNVQVQTPRLCLSRRTPFVFIGNNAYSMDLLNLGARTTLEAGHLSLYLTQRSGRFGLFRLALRGLLGRLNQARDFESLMLETCLIETRRPKIRVALDGEVTTMHPPLLYRIRPKALPLIVAPEGTKERM